MKKEIHPKYKELIVKIGKDSFKTNSTYHGSEILMDVDFRTHPAWNGGGVSTANSSNKNISTFNDKYAGLLG